LIPLFAGHGPFLVVVPSGDAVVAVLSTRSPGGAAGVCVVEPHLPDPLWLAVHAFFNWDLSYNTVSAVARSLFLSQLLSIFFELLHVCLRRNEVQFCLLHFCDVKVLVCDDDEHVNILSLLYAFCLYDL
jgi:hypothetical protein